MNHTPELSIVIPVYNVAAQLPTCLDAVINQSFKDTEILVIDDASTDNSAEIVRKYAHKCANVKPIFFDQNTGVGNVRNYGIELSKGKYIGFVDSDDWIDLEYYHRLLDAIKRDKSQIAICGIKTEYNNSKSCELRYKYNFHNCIDNTIALKLLTKSQGYDCYITPIVNNKIYDRKFLQKRNIKFNNNRSFQDDYFSFFALLKASLISLVPDVYYHYYQRESSITHTFSKSLVDDCLNTLVQIRSELEFQNLLDIYEKEYYAFVERLIVSLLDMLLRKEPDIIIQKKYLKYIWGSFAGQFQMNKVIDYIDNRRIFHFFDM